jgi:purine-binding chemotaxis protein CheW
MSFHMQAQTEKTENLNVDAVDRFLCFSLGEEEFAVPLLKVREVIAMPELTAVPFAPSYFLGVMNLRGQVITVMDLRNRLGIKTAGATDASVVICDLGGGVVGVTVDSVNSVIHPKLNEIAERPDVSGQVKTMEYVLGVYRKEHKLVLLLDIAKALGVADLLNSAKKAS